MLIKFNFLLFFSSRLFKSGVNALHGLHQVPQKSNKVNVLFLEIS